MKSAIEQRFTEAELKEGTRCPCCGQRVQVYRRAITSSMARVLLEMTGRPKEAEAYFHVPSWISGRFMGAAARGGDWAKPSHWGLILQEQIDQSEGDSRTGFWAVTKRGRDFVAGKVTVPKYVFIYDGKVQKMSKEQTTFKASLKDPFLYEQVVKGEW